MRAGSSFSGLERLQVEFFLYRSTSHGVFVKCGTLCSCGFQYPEQLGAEALLEEIEFARFGTDLETDNDLAGARDMSGTAAPAVVCAERCDAEADVRADDGFRSINSQLRVTLLPIEKDVVGFWPLATLEDSERGA